MDLRSTLLVLAALTAAFIAGRATIGPQPVDAQTPFAHFKCYQTAVKLPQPRIVGLRDQFDSSRMQLVFADLFCTPVRKQLIGANPQPLPGPSDHLLCDRGQAPPVNHVRQIANQLQRTRIQLATPRYVCVPTWKTSAAI